MLIQLHGIWRCLIQNEEKLRWIICLHNPHSTAVCCCQSVSVSVSISVIIVLMFFIVVPLCHLHLTFFTYNTTTDIITSWYLTSVQRKWFILALHTFTQSRCLFCLFLIVVAEPSQVGFFTLLDLGVCLGYVNDHDIASVRIPFRLTI